LIFKKGRQTSKVWFFEVNEDGFKKTTSKKGRPPIKENDLPRLRSLWNDKIKTKNSFFVDFKKIKSSSYKLFMNYYRPRKLIKYSKELNDICEEPILGGTPSKKEKEYYGNKYLWVTITDMKEKYINDTQLKLSEKGMNYLKSKEIKKGTLLMSFKLTLGKTAFAGKDLFTNEAICGLIPKDKKDKTISEYLFYILPLIDYMPYAQRASKGYTLNKELVPTVEIPFPNKLKRKKIIMQLKKMLKNLEKEKERFKNEISKKEKEINVFFNGVLFK
jgi:hypothetical protein